MSRKVSVDNFEGKRLQEVKKVHRLGMDPGTLCRSRVPSWACLCERAHPPEHVREHRTRQSTVEFQGPGIITGLSVCGADALGGSRQLHPLKPSAAN